MSPAITIDPNDNLAVALINLTAGQDVTIGEKTIRLEEDIPAKHKFTLEAFPKGHRATMYGVTVGVATQDIAKGGLISTGNLAHDADAFSTDQKGDFQWNAPDVSQWVDRTFDGYHRSDGSVGTGNYWLVIPMVFLRNAKHQRHAASIRAFTRLWENIAL